MFAKTLIELGASESPNWSLIIAISSLIVSIITLYLAHIKGSKISLVTPKGLYPVVGYYSDRNTLVIDIFFANTGIRSGILYDVGLSSKYPFIQPQSSQTNFETDPEKRSLPKVLIPGQEWIGKVQVTLGLNGTEGKQYLSSNNTLKLTISYSHDASFGRQVTTKKEIHIDLRVVKHSHAMQIY